jgi:hypothetical protein
MQYGTNWLIQEYLGRVLHAEHVETQTIRNQTFTKPVHKPLSRDEHEPKLAGHKRKNRYSMPLP